MVKRVLFSSVVMMFSCSNPNTNNHHEISKEVLSDSSIVISDSLFTSGIEGPAVNSIGDLYLVNIKEEGTIARKQLDSTDFELYLKLPAGSVGNGIRFNQQGDMFIADYPKHNILKVEHGTRHVELFAHNESMNQPNDLAVMDNGILFASDPNWKLSTGSIYKIDPSGNVQLLEDSMGTTNGIEVSPNNKLLYVNESVQRRIWAYDLDASGNVSNKRLFHEFDDHGMDGMRCDRIGNLYVTRYGAGVVVVINPAGDVVRTINLVGKKPTNVAFGGKNGKTVFVTLQDTRTVESFQAEFPGRNY